MAVTWQCSVINLDDETLISGVILSGNPFTYKKHVSTFKSLRKLLLSYFWRTYRKRAITIHAAGREIQTKTDAHGGFSVVVDFPVEKDISITSDRGERLELLQTYPVLFNIPDAHFYVISDIDDTIMVSHSAHAIKRVLTLLLKAPQDRKPVFYVRELLRQFAQQRARVFYISKSESNLFSMLTAFIRHNDLPQGALTLTPYLRFAELFQDKNGQHYKDRHIRFLLDNSREKKFVLIGDDSQEDIEIYARIAKAYPDRIMRVYIRQTKATRSDHQQQMWNDLVATGVDGKYFRVDDQASDELQFFQT